MEMLYTGKKFLFLAAFIFAANIYGQGTIKGVVTDSLSHDPLVGANVFLVGTALGAAVDIEGNYVIADVPAGKHTVRFSYVGYKSKEITINIKSNSTVSLNMQLVPAAVIGKEVIVSAQAEGQAAAINQQLNSNSIVNVVSEQKIQELPDANAAEAIGRLPGVSLTRSGGEANKVILRGLSSQFTTVTIDGVRIPATDATDRGVDLSVLSQGSLSGIELFKALTSDQDADAIAGTINLVTKKAPEERLVRVDVTGKYNGLDKSVNQYNFEGRYGERFFNGAFGVQAIGNVERTIRSHEYYKYGYDQSINNYSDYIINDFTIQYQNEVRTRNGGSILLDLNTPDKGSIRFNNQYSETGRDYVNNQRDYPYESGITYDYEDVQTKIKEFTSNLFGNNNLFGLSVDWGFAYSQSKNETPLDWLMEWDEASSSSGGKLISGMQNVPQNLLKGPVQDWAQYSLNNFNVAALGNAEDQPTANFEKNRTAHLDILKSYNISNSLAGEFKFGAKVRSDSRYYNSFQYRDAYYLSRVSPYIRTADGKFVATDFTGTRFAGLEGSQSVPMSYFLDNPIKSRDVFNLYDMNPLINQDAIEEWRSLNINGYQAAINDPQAASFLNNLLQQDNDYNLTENVYAGYLMNTLDLGHIVSLITGVRLERDDDSYTGKYSLNTLGTSAVVPSKGELTDITTPHQETNIMPNVQAIIRPTDFWNLRLASYRALARPNFSDRLPKYVAIIASNKELHIGNPDLKNAKAWNYEIENQFYGNDIGLFSVSVFYKEIKDMFISVDGLQTSGTQFLDSLGINWHRFVGNNFTISSNYNLYTEYNNDKPTKVWGVEVEHQANFRFLPGLLKNIILDYNFSFVRSETWVTNNAVIDVPRPPLPPIKKTVIVSEKQKLADQPNFFMNADLGYDIDGFSFRISVFHEGAYNTSFSSDERSDVQVNAFTRWDIAIKQEITDHLSAFLNLYNITDAEDSRDYLNRIEIRQLPYDSQRYGRTAEFVLRYEL
jgi:TonB-dependent receptor